MDNLDQRIANELFPEGGEEGEEVLENKDEIVEPAASTIKLGEKEYSQEELTRLVQLGEIGKEVEEKYNTKLDRVYPEYTKATQRLKELEEVEKKYVETQEQNKRLLPENEEAAIKEAREAARKLGLVDVETFQDMLGKSFRTFYEQERAAERLLETADKLESEIDGNDGRPKFNKEVVLQYMVDNGMSKADKDGMLTAYKLLNEEALDKWKEEKLTAAKKPGLRTHESTSAGVTKSPGDVKVTTENLDRLVAEALEGKF